MYNGFMFNKSQQSLKVTTLWKQKFERTPVQGEKHKTYTSQSKQRTTQWIGENLNGKATTLLQNGCSSLAHPDQYQFREYTPMGSIYLRKYYNSFTF